MNMDRDRRIEVNIEIDRLMRKAADEGEDVEAWSFALSFRGDDAGWVVGQTQPLDALPVWDTRRKAEGV